ncbi:MAG: hypothetical protein AB8B63_06530 [Granulosicoccus sp.]
MYGSDEEYLGALKSFLLGEKGSHIRERLPEHVKADLICENEFVVDLWKHWNKLIVGPPASSLSDVDFYMSAGLEFAEIQLTQLLYLYSRIAEVKFCSSTDNKDPVLKKLVEAERKLAAIKVRSGAVARLEALHNLEAAAIGLGLPMNFFIRRTSATGIVTIGSETTSDLSYKIRLLTVLNRHILEKNLDMPTNHGNATPVAYAMKKTRFLMSMDQHQIPELVPDAFRKIRLFAELFNVDVNWESAIRKELKR